MNLRPIRLIYNVYCLCVSQKLQAEEDIELYIKSKTYLL